LPSTIQQQYADLGYPLKLMMVKCLAEYCPMKASKQTKAGEGVRKN